MKLNQEYLTLTEVVDYLRLAPGGGGRRILMRAIVRGELRTVRLGRGHLFRVAWLDQWMEDLAYEQKKSIPVGFAALSS